LNNFKLGVRIRNTPPLVEQYIERNSIPFKLAIEEIKVMLPPPEALRSGCASWLKWNADSKFVAIRNEYSFSVIWSAGLKMAVPALFTYICKIFKHSYKRRKMTVAVSII
jgi:hypothetical protein